jgi:hypothetical protein
MIVIITWLIFAVVPAIAASARGRSAIGWFILSVAISPLIALILVLVLPNLRHEQLLKQLAGARDRPLARSGFGGSASRITVDRSANAFTPDGVLAGIRYAVLPNGMISAMMAGGIVNFRSIEQFQAAANGETLEQSSTVDPTILSKYPQEANGIRFRVEKNGNVVTWSADRGEKTYSTWREFYDITQIG